MLKMDQSGTGILGTSTPSTSGSAPGQIVTIPGGKYLLIKETTGFRTYSYDSTNGTALLGSLATPGVVIDLKVSPSGLFAYASVSSNLYAYSINPATGVLTAIGGAVPNTNSVDSIAIDKTGRFLYAASTTDIRGYAILSDGSLTALPTSPFASSAVTAKIVIESGNRFLYAGSTIALKSFTLNPTTGELANSTVAIASACSTTMYSVIASR